MQDAIPYKSKNPILNNPYEEPKLYYDTDLDGNIDYTAVRKGRRPFGYKVSIEPHKTNKTFFSQEDFVENDPDAKFVNGIRDRVKKWREAGYPMVSRITKELFDFWFNPKRQYNLKLFFCQQEAIETAVWLNEIAEKDTGDGFYYINQLNERDHSVSTNDEDVLPRTAFKMATGTGKTVVMAMLILYNYLNKQAYPMDTHYADHFLICAPGITIRDRLSVLQLDAAKPANKLESNDYYHKRDLIPPQFENKLGGLNASIKIINFQQFIPRSFSGKHVSPFDGKIRHIDGKKEKQEGQESYSLMLSRILEKGVKGKRIIVINDEAHHCYLTKPNNTKNLSDDEKEDLNTENANAHIWYEGLRQMKLNGYKIQHVYDLSATPYYLNGSGYKAYSLFPWVVSDFGLVDAIESGLVKIPFLPVFDNAKGLDGPVLRNLYDHIKSELPKMGQKASRKKEKEDGKDTKNEPINEPKIPPLLRTALKQFYDDYRDYEDGLRKSFEDGRSLDEPDPVMIIVCNNTSLSKEVYHELAGYKRGIDNNGKPFYKDSLYSEFSNYTAMGAPKEKFPTLLIDSASLDQASETIDENFKNNYAKEIEAFEVDFVNQGRGSREDITDADILREVVNTVGKPGKLGAKIKCVVSVSMLTEGWDANTVTHVCGIRAFGSQLLCEQVVGRALRRKSYELSAYNKEGELIDPKDLKRYNKDNVTLKFPPEYARIIGVPFKSFKGGTTEIPPRQKPKQKIYALSERSDMEIKFPVITGYRIEQQEGKIVANFEGLPKFVLNFDEIPTKTVLQAAINDKTELLKSDYEEYRDQHVVYYFIQLIMNNLKVSIEHFSEVRDLVWDWYNNQLEIRGGDGHLEQKRLVILSNPDDVLNNIKKGIDQANYKMGKSKIIAVLNYYNPEGSTSHVFHLTSRPVFYTKKCHVNGIACTGNTVDESWEAQTAKVLESTKGVECYVRNKYLDFQFPYTLLNKTKWYLPDFILRLKGKSGNTVNVILELHGFDNDKVGEVDIKRHALYEYWIPSVNDLVNYGTWSVLEVNDLSRLKEMLNDKIKTL